MPADLCRERQSARVGADDVRGMDHILDERELRSGAAAGRGGLGLLSRCMGCCGQFCFRPVARLALRLGLRRTVACRPRTHRRHAGGCRDDEGERPMRWSSHGAWRLSNEFCAPSSPPKPRPTGASQPHGSVDRIAARLPRHSRCMGCLGDFPRFPAPRSRRRHCPPGKPHGAWRLPEISRRPASPPEPRFGGGARSCGCDTPGTASRSDRARAASAPCRRNAGRCRWMPRRTRGPAERGTRGRRGSAVRCRAQACARRASHCRRGPGVSYESSRR